MKLNIIRSGKRKSGQPMSGQSLRFSIQLAFIALCLWIGVEFTLWYMTQAGSIVLATLRPPGVEGFLPISALMSLWYWMLSGDFNFIHPAGTVILLAILIISMVVKKSFCSWFCPVGTISENLGEFGKHLFGRNFTVWKWLDYPLRSMKYLLFGFLVYVVVFQMDVYSLKGFLESPYNRVADVKMFLFFKEISRTSIIVLSILVAFSLFIKHFWCRYLCPYGALLGIVGLFSPFRITRNSESCIDCAECARVCPAAINVEKMTRVMSDECTSCLACVDACPVAETLQLKISKKSHFVLQPRFVATMVVALFMVITGTAMLLGYWKSSIPREEYSRRIKDIGNPLYQHNYGSAAVESNIHSSYSTGERAP